MQQAFQDVQTVLEKYKASMEVLLLNKHSDNKDDSEVMSSLELFGTLAALVVGQAVISNSEVQLPQMDVLRHRIEVCLVSFLC